ncbi:MAG: hypothetical protein JXA66_04555 [Oligoflexia bacterium]|nr:hypothetical protein [Oligoflexia bacterium]
MIKKLFYILTAAACFCFNVSASGAAPAVTGKSAEKSRVIKQARYVIRSTANGDTEMLINNPDGNITISLELQKFGCDRLWDKGCWTKKNYTGKISPQKVRGIISAIQNSKYYKNPLPPYMPAPGEDQYSIGLIYDREPHLYMNLTHGKLDKFNDYNDLKRKFDEILKLFVPHVH